MCKIQETPIMALCHAVRNAYADMECSLRRAIAAHGVGRTQHSVARALEIYHATNRIDGAVKEYCRSVGEEMAKDAKMSELRQKQSRFVVMVADLIQYLTAKGYRLTFGDAWAKTGHRENSLHYDRLAIDLNIFKDGEWLTDGRGHDEGHDFWDSIGGAARIPEDANHYSVEHEGRL